MDTRDILDSVTMKKAEEIGIKGLGSFLIQNLKTDQGWTQTCGRRAQRQGEAQYQGLVCVRQEERASSTGTCQSHVAPVLMIYRTSYIKSLDFTWSLLELLNGKDKRKAFQEVFGKFRPVMHHFFLERFLQPADWFEKRLAYTRSVAASSMVGYIVGLGDRHAMNILIDQTTAEVVHIDLGVAFEQGLMLKTPERVPFRLTRDIIDGMGVTGIEGVYRRCCEETLSVMRTNKEALLTIVEVFIHDPLYKWALSPLKALQRQKETDYELETSLEDSQDEYEGNKDAARALMRVKQKLDGYEEGEMRSIHGQVQQLVQDAIDPERLCQLFPGWGAWL